MKQKRRIFILLVILMLILCACSNSGAELEDESVTASTEEIEDESTEENNDTMSDVNQIIFGIMSLDGTNDEITKEQAETLLPLWQLYESMMEEDATASEELEAIISQIKSVLTDEQLSMMADMDYSDMMEKMSQFGLESLEEISDEEGDMMMWAMPGNGDNEGMPEGGEFDRENMPEGGAATDTSGGGGGGGRVGGNVGGMAEGMTGDGSGTGVDITGSIDPNALATVQAESAGSSRTNRQTQMFLPALIEYLEIKAES